MEAVSAYSKENKRIIEEMSVLEEYTSSNAAWSGYKKLHREFPERELYIFHTSKEQIEVEEQHFIGVRGLEGVDSLVTANQSLNLCKKLS